jgi:hypothetical protein
VGLKIQFGSMTKSFHPGRAAQNGLTAALMAQQKVSISSAVSCALGGGWAGWPARAKASASCGGEEACGEWPWQASSASVIDCITSSLRWAR